jgi:hypothetical protein
VRVWDVNPGYLNRQSLLGEHREIHAIVSIITHGKKGYAHHPETLRWKEGLAALKYRHDLVVSEMRLRGYRHHSPVTAQGPLAWPAEFVDPLASQFAILETKYRDREPGRIPLPQSAQQLWAQHEYSIRARGPTDRCQDKLPFEQLAHECVGILRTRPSEDLVMDALRRMWEHVSQFAGNIPDNPVALIEVLRDLSFRHHAVYLLESTALSDLHAWISAPLADRETTNQG